MGANGDLPAVKASTKGGSDSSRACSPEYPSNKQALKHHQDQSVQRHEVRTYVTMQDAHKMAWDNTLVAMLPDAECKNSIIYNPPKAIVQIEVNRR